MENYPIFKPCVAASKKEQLSLLGIRKKIMASEMEVAKQHHLSGSYLRMDLYLYCFITLITMEFTAA